MDIWAKNVYQSMVGKGFSRKENIKANYAKIGAVYTVTLLIGPNEDMVKNGKGKLINVRLK